MDLVSSYYQLELDEESKKLTAFSTPFGDYEYNRLPMGASPSADCIGEALDGAFTPMNCYPRFLRVVDDILRQGETWEKLET